MPPELPFPPEPPFPFPDSSFHHAFSMEALYYSQDLPAALGEVRRVLRPGGTLTFCTDFFEENPHCHGWPEQMGIPMLLLSERGWREALEAAGLQVEASFRCLDPRPPDPAQSEQEQQATLHFRTEVGSLTLRARRDDETPSS